MKRKQCGFGQRMKALASGDAKEIATFEKFLRLTSEAEKAGVPRLEAGQAIYEDLYLYEEAKT